MSDVTNINCVLIGDASSEKTDVLTSYRKLKLPDDYIATVFDYYESQQVVDGKTVHLNFWDSAGKEEYDRLKSLGFPDADVFIIFFSISDPVSFQNVEVKYIPEIKKFIEGIPVIIVGTKADLRESPPEGVKLVQTEDAEQMVERLGLTAYVECSAKAQQNLSKVFELAAHYVLKKNQQQETKKSGKCTIL
ncbi:Rac2e, Rho family GTPase [Monocercomonoides exilis]|uniref:Rac2e, Rho family GTPase n=1 Tax=Monocercomonoides exilis TaxID=2049356 RepID=UPI0035595156|nr:Rac2e, Rho family GTPase [Monocercomonoides exilis]|eukprot:MONOS_5725.1-p1 / transcript=MONOS_5725.1 / gene=MONOS_5725 / organism=Monocercomonoides_exilis_PA203 / gene_product=Rac2e, Rho family GTPase / transcript_product=Rac2e, Rho family GTPase / location=Mono_scaffold00170:92790-93570(-) / protein_length=191 / sequence_SO=supercontig / SO=protein_coding / is_pseudo=false